MHNESFYVHHYTISYYNATTRYHFALIGEVFSLVPPTSLEHLSRSIRMKILEEIGRIGMSDLFHFVPFEQLQWYANTLFKDTLSQNSVTSKQRRQLHDEKQIKTTDQLHASSSSSSENVADPTNDDSPDPTEDGIQNPESHSIEKSEKSATARMGGDEPLLSQFGTQQITIDADVIQKLGNFFCYAEDIFVGNWNIQFFKDTLESKSVPGEKTCCIPHVQRMKWFELLKKAYGADTANWSEFHLSAIGDLLITVPEDELAKIPREALGNAVHPILKQSGFDNLISVPGESKKQRFINICTEGLGTEGNEMGHSYKSLMKQITEGAQWLASTVKTTEELLKDSMGRSGRLPRWAEFTLVRTPRQVNILIPQNQLKQMPNVELYGNRDQNSQPTVGERQLIKQEQPRVSQAPLQQGQIQLVPQREPVQGRTQNQQNVQGQFIPRSQQQGRLNVEHDFRNQFQEQSRPQPQKTAQVTSGMQQYEQQLGPRNQGQQFGQNRYGPQIPQGQEQFGSQLQKPGGQGNFGSPAQPLDQFQQGQQVGQFPQHGQEQFGPQSQQQGQGRFVQPNQQGKGEFVNQFENQQRFGIQEGPFNSGQDPSSGQADLGGVRQGQFVDQSRFRGQQQGQFNQSPDQRLDLTARRVNGTESSARNATNVRNHPQSSESHFLVGQEGRSASADAVVRGVNDQVCLIDGII